MDRKLAELKRSRASHMNHFSTREEKIILLQMLHNTSLPPLSSKFEELNNFQHLCVQFSKMMKVEVAGTRGGRSHSCLCSGVARRGVAGGIPSPPGTELREASQTGPAPAPTAPFLSPSLDPAHARGGYRSFIINVLSYCTAMSLRI